MQRTTIVTGSSGFIGQALLKKQNELPPLSCPTRDELQLSKNPVELCLLADEIQAKQILHLAHPRIYGVNSAFPEALSMMRNVLEACRLRDLRLVYLSNLAVYSGHSELEYVNTKTHRLPSSLYGQTKYLCEQLAEVYREANGIDVSIIRPAYVYGPEMSPFNIVSRFFQLARKNATITVHKYANGFQTFDFLYVNDLIEAIAQIISSAHVDSLNLGTGVPNNTFDLAKLILKLVNSSSEIKIMSVTTRPPKLVVDPQEAKQLIQWSAKTSLFSGLARVSDLQL